MSPRRPVGWRTQRTARRRWRCRMRDARGIFGDAAVVEEDRFYVPRRGARKLSRSVSRTGSTALARGLVANSFQRSHGTGSCRKTERGSRHPGLPLFGAQLGPPVRLDAGRPRMIHRIYWAAPSVIGSTDTNTRPLALVRNSTRPSIKANRVWSRPTPTLRPGCHLVPALALQRCLPAGARTFAARGKILMPQLAGRRNRDRYATTRPLSCGQPGLNNLLDYLSTPDS